MFSKTMMNPTNGQPTSLAHTNHLRGEVDLEGKSSEGSSNFIFKVGLAIVAFCLAGVAA